MKHSKLERQLTQRGCKWVFHPPWRISYTILGNSPMNEEVLHTVFTEAERIANSRPLTLNPSSPNDNDPLVPSHFLNVHPSLNIPPDVFDEKDKFSRKLSC